MTSRSLFTNSDSVAEATAALGTTKPINRVGKTASIDLIGSWDLGASLRTRGFTVERTAKPIIRASVELQQS